MITKNIYHRKYFELKNTFKEAIRYLSNVVTLFNKVFYLKLNFKLKIDPKMCNFENLEKICQKRLATLTSVHCTLPRPLK